MRFAILEGDIIHAPTPQAFGIDDQRSPPASFHDFGCSVYLDPSRHPRLDRCKIIDHQRNQYVACFHVLVLECLGDIEASDEESFSVEAKTDRGNIGLTGF
jgi:hypothetical protein